MPTYVALLNWTEQGMKNVKDTVDRYEEGRQSLEQLGATVREIFWTVGPYDLVATVDAPDDATASAALLALASEGNVRSLTLRAFTADEMRGVLQRIP